MHVTTIKRGSIALLALLTIASFAQAALQENQVVLLYNSQNAESLAIRNAYVAQYPNVLQFDLNLTYPTVPPTPRQDAPPPEEINNQYITASKFQALFLGRNSAFRQYLNANPQVLAIVTTRGLPGAVSDNFDPEPMVGMGQPIDGVWASFEAALSHPGIVSGGNPLLKVVNPYYGATVAFQKFLVSAEPGEPTFGDMYLVTRLDANSVSDVVALIDRSAAPAVNMYATSFVFDVSGTSFQDFESNVRWAMAKLWEAEWCVLYDDTDQFVHGPTDPDYDPATDAAFNEYPWVGYYGFGRNHGGPESIGYYYTQHFNAAIGGTFSSLESGNGWTIHEPGNYAWNQGQVLDWISYAEGSFGIGNIQEPLTTAVSRPDPLYPNFYCNGLCWAEAAYTSLPYLGQYQTPIGNPMALIMAYNPDLDGDRIVGMSDLAIVLANLNTSGPAGDINGDGWVDDDDKDLVLEAYNRDNTQNPLTPLGANGLGDLDGDCYVDQSDLATLLALMGDCPSPPPSDPNMRCLGDLNGDAVVDDSDKDILLAHYNELLGDVDLDGDVDNDDKDLLLASYNLCVGDPGFNPDADINDDGCVDMSDLGYVLGCMQ